jgi:hypothetical protein
MQTTYPKARTKFLKGDIAWESDTFKAVAMDASYTYSAGHEFEDDLDGILGSVNLSGEVALDYGWADAADPTITGMTPGLTVARFAIVRVVGSAATNDLIWYADTYANTTAIGRLVDSSGSMTFSFSNGTGRIFQLGS